MSLLDKIDEQKLKEHGSEYAEFLKNGGTVISPSGLRNLYDNPRVWYRNTILKEKTFDGNANTKLGSCIHQLHEDYFNGDLTKKDEVHKWKIDYISKGDTEVVKEYERISKFFLEEYLKVIPKPEYVEEYLEFEIYDDLKICGTIDALSKEGSEWVLTDIKTSSRSAKDMNDYILQLSVYARLLKEIHNIEVNKLRIVQLVKTKEPKLNIIEDDVNWDLASEALNKAVKMCRLLANNEELADVFMSENYFSFTSDKSMSINPRVAETKSMKHMKQKEYLKRHVFS